ncbi:prion-like-(Q/N-rich) domain-bearing protein 25 [Saccostrea cucullata]|uniref:prion-like-(Q/N-rich) domain-bearing protein 25 n=1 Tax=Saccostrea cuccullata TaxID=36930 RepID=UPI002ED225A7
MCTSTKNCEDPSKSCSRSYREEIGVCKCRDGYIRFGSNCFKGNLQLNESCQRNVQCSGTVGSVCQNNKCVCGSGYIPLNDSSCFSQNIIKDMCTSTKNCEDPSKSCSRSYREEIGVCKCRDGYIRFGSNCFKGNLQLNESCQRNVQCSGTVGSVCQNNKCVCGSGYIPLIDSSCFSQNITKDLCTSTKNCESIQVMFAIV